MSDKSGSLYRRKVLQSLGAATAVASTPPLVQGRESYPVVDHEHTNLPVSELEMDSASDPKIAKHPQHDRIAVATPLFDQGLELYIATGVESRSEEPSEVLQITSNSQVGAVDLQWHNGNRLEFWRDGEVYELKLPPSHVVFEPEQVGERLIPNIVDKGGDA